MGLFGGKKKTNEGIPVQYYEGSLTGFECNCPCGIRLEDDCLLIARGNPSVEVRLNRNRITGIDIFLYEEQYMAKYKGTNITTSKSKSTPKHYYVINYIDKSGQPTHIDFWGTSFETGKVRKFKEEILRNSGPSNYEI